MNGNQSYDPNGSQISGIQPEGQAQQPPYQQQSQSPSPITDPFGGVSMKWHKFLAYFLIWAGSASNAVSGIFSLFGLQYGAEKDLVYLFFPALRTTDMIFGLLTLGCAAFGFYAAYRLLKLKKGAPRLLTYLYAAVAVVSFLFVVATLSILSRYSAPADATDVWSRTIGSVAGSIAMIFINRSYYKKRVQFFINE